MNNWLISPTVQIVDINGTPVVGGKVFVYDADTSNLSTIYSDEDVEIANPVLIDELGNVTIWAELSKLYDIAVYDANDNLLFAKKHLCPGILSETNLDINAGEGCIVTKAGDTYTISVDFDLVATQAELATKQDKLEAGRNIEITQQNVINVTGRRPIVTQAPIQSNMTDSAWIVSFDSDAFIGGKGLMETTGLDFDPMSSRYISYKGIPLGEPGDCISYNYMNPVTSFGYSGDLSFVRNNTNGNPDRIIANVDGNPIGLFPPTSNINNAIFTLNYQGSEEWIAKSAFSADFYTKNEASSMSSMLSGAIDYVSSNMPAGFTGVSANIPLTGNGTNESPLGLLPYISYGGNGITATFSKSGLRVLDGNNNSAYYSASGINLNNASITETDVNKWNSITGPNIVYQTSSIEIPSGVWQNGQLFNTNLFVGAGKKFTGTLTLKVLACNSPNFHVDVPGHGYLSECGGDYQAYRSNHHYWPIYVDNTNGSTPYEIWFKLYGDFPSTTTNTFLDGIEI